MRETNAAIQGIEPVYRDLRIGLDGQLWRWTARGQETVASGGDEAVQYAEKHGLPESVVRLLKSAHLSANPLARKG